MKLTGNKILITGGTSGIGKELAFRLKKLGNEVIVLGRNEQQLNIAKARGMQTIQSDLQNQNDIENAVLYLENHHADLNMLFNNAGVQYNYQFIDETLPFDKIRKEMNINIIGQMLLTQMLLPILRNQTESFIINTTSGLGVFPKSDGLIYSASKAAMRNFTIGLRYALKQTSVKVLEFMPPVTDTAMTAKRDEKKISTQKLVDSVINQIEKEKKLITIPSLKIFIWLSFLFPGLAHKIVSK